MFGKNNDRQKSERLYEELQKSDTELAGVKKRKADFLESAETQSFFLKLGVAERILNSGDPYLSHLQGKVDELRAAACAEEGAWIARDRELRKALRGVTAGVIDQCLEKLRLELLSQKIERRVLEQTQFGFDMTRRVRILTNEDGVFEVHRIAKEAREKLSGMSCESIPTIEGYIDEQLIRIRAVDLGLKEKTVPAVDHERQAWVTAPVSRGV